MGTHIKTTIDIADDLLAAARERAREEGTTLRALVERGLAAVLNAPTGLPEHEYQPVTAQLEPLPGVDPDDWERLRELSYEPPERGGRL
jgi:hypothetical protein